MNKDVEEISSYLLSCYDYQQMPIGYSSALFSLKGDDDDDDFLDLFDSSFRMCVVCFVLSGFEFSESFCPGDGNHLAVKYMESIDVPSQHFELVERLCVE